MKKIREWEARQDAKLERKLYMGGGGSSSGPTTQTVQQNTIAPEASPYYSTTLGQAAALTDINQHPYQQYQGERVAGFDPMQTQAFNQLQNMQLPGQTQQASDTAAGIASQAQGYQGYQPGQFGTANANNAALMQSYMNPYIQTALDPTLQLMQQNAAIGQRTLGQQAQKAGAFGGYRQGIQQGVQAGQDALAQGNVIGNMYQQGYGAASQNFQADMARKLQAQQMREQSRQFGGTLGLQGLNTSLQAAGLQGQMGQQQYAQQMGLNQAQQLAGAQKQALEQQRLGIGYENFLNQQNWPYKNLAFMSDIIGRPLQNTSTSIYQAPPTAGQSLLGLGMGAYGLSQMVKAKGGIIDAYADGGFVKKDFLTPKEDPENKGLIDPATLTGIAAIDENAFVYDPALQQYTKLGIPPPTPAPPQPIRPGDIGPGAGTAVSGEGTDAGDAAAANAAAAEGVADAAGMSGADAGGVGAAPYRKGGKVKYADGGDVVSTLNTLSKLPPNYLRRMQQYQPWTGMVQKQNRQLQTAAPMPASAQLTPPKPETGIAQLPANNMEFAEGGIVGYADGGDIEWPTINPRGIEVIPTKRRTPIDEQTRSDKEAVQQALKKFGAAAVDVGGAPVHAARIAGQYGIRGLRALGFDVGSPPSPDERGWTPYYDYYVRRPEQERADAIAAGPPQSLAEDNARLAKLAQIMGRGPKRKAAEEADVRKEQAQAAGPATTQQSTTASGIAALTAPSAYVPPNQQERIAAHKAYMEGARDPETEALIEKLGSGIGDVAAAQTKALDRSTGAAWLKAGAEALKAGQPGIIGALSRAGESLGTSVPQIESARAAAAEWRQKAEQLHVKSQIEYRKGNLDTARAMAKEEEQAREKAKDFDAKIYAAQAGLAGQTRSAEAHEYAARLRLQGDKAQAGAMSDFRQQQLNERAVEKAHAQAKADVEMEFKRENPFEQFDLSRVDIQNRVAERSKQLLRMYYTAAQKGTGLPELLKMFDTGTGSSGQWAGWGPVTRTK